MRGYFESDFFGGQFGPRFGEMFGPFGGPFGSPSRGDFSGHHGPRGFGPFGHSFDHSPERNEHHYHGPEHQKRGPPEDGYQGLGCHHGPEHQRRGPPEDGHQGPGCHHGPEHHRRGPPEDGHRGPRCHHGPEHHRRGPPEVGQRGPRCQHESDSDSDGPADHHCHGLPGFKGRGGPRDFRGHGPSCHNSGPRFGRNLERNCFGRRGPSDFPDRPWKGPWGAGRHMRDFGRHGPWFGHRRPCPYDSEDRPTRKADCEKCRDNQPCCSGNKENQGRGKGRKGNGPCGDKDKDQNHGDTVYVQRIVLEKATRPQSV